MKTSNLLLGLFVVLIVFVVGTACASDIDEELAYDRGGPKIRKKAEPATSSTTSTTSTTTTTDPPVTAPPETAATTTAPPPPPETAPPVTAAQTLPPAEVASGGSGCVIPDYICERESRYTYDAINPSSGAGGMYQLMPRTANAMAREAGRPDLVGVPPHTMAPQDQDMLASQLWAGGSGCSHWSAC